MKKLTWMSLIALGTGGATDAQEATSYSYDPLGRLVGTTSIQGSSTVSDQFTYDNAGNRIRIEITGAAPAKAVVVLPLSGYLVIPTQ